MAPRSLSKILRPSGFLQRCQFPENAGQKPGGQAERPGPATSETRRDPARATISFMFQGLEHTAIASPNPEKLAHWYVDNLGF